MYRIVKHSDEYFVGQITKEDYLEELEETYPGERDEMDEEIQEPWVMMVGGTYADVKRYLES